MQKHKEGLVRHAQPFISLNTSLLQVLTSRTSPVDGLELGVFPSNLSS